MPQTKKDPAQRAGTGRGRNLITATAISSENNPSALVVQGRRAARPALVRQHFSVSRAAEYFRAAELQAQTGQPASEFAHVALKELIDNALDAAEAAGVAPRIEISFEETDTEIILTVADNGRGIPAEVVTRILDFSTRTSDKAAYRAPTRGQQGNALKTLLGIPVALGAAESRLTLEGAGSRHEIAAWITPASEVKTEHVQGIGPEGGARISVSLPRAGLDWDPVSWAFRFALFNPHAEIQIPQIEAGGGSFKLAKSKGSDSSDFPDLSFSSSVDFLGGRWRKFLPTDLTPASWYSLQEFSALAYLKADREPSFPLSRFVQEFRCLSRRWRPIVSGLGIATLGELVKSPGAISDLRAAIIEAADPPNPEVLGRVGADHFRAHFDGAFGVVGGRFWYKHRFGTADHLPFMVETAIAETEQDGDNFFGLNYSAPFGDPLAGLEFSNKDIEGYGLSGFLTELGVYNGDFYVRRPLKTAAAFHLVMPVLPTLDRGKSRLSTPREVNAAAAEIMAAAAKTLTAESERWRRNRSKARSEYAAAEKETKARARSEQMTKAEAVDSILLETYLQVTEDETIYVTARDLYYAIRPKFSDLDVRSSKNAHGRETDELNFGYFSQTVLPAFRREHHPLTMVDYKARGSLYSPHGEQTTPIGDKELRTFEFPVWEYNKILYIEKEGVWETLKQTGGIEFAKRYDMAIATGSGFATEAVRALLAKAQGKDFQIFVWHDADPSGYEIARTLAEETTRMPDHRIEVFDLGLNLLEAIEMGLQAETFTRKKELSAALVERLTSDELRLFGGQRVQVGESKFQWHRCQRVEINAIPIMERVAYLESQLEAIPELLGKVRPPDAELPRLARSIYEGGIHARIHAEIERRIDIHAIANRAYDQIKHPELDNPNLPQDLEDRLHLLPSDPWRIALAVLLRPKMSTILGDEIRSVVDVAIREELRDAGVPEGGAE